MRALVICAGDSPSKDLAVSEYKAADLRMAVDGGAEVYKRFNLLPDVLIGDMDSLNPKTLEYFSELGVETIKHRPEKDLTDTQIAMRVGVERGCVNMTFLGALGGRFDHTYANVLLLENALRIGLEAQIRDDVNLMYFKSNSFSVIKRKKYISFYSFGNQVRGLTLRGFKYPLKDYTLKEHDILCTSNEVVENQANVDFLEGVLLVVESGN